MGGLSVHYSNTYQKLVIGRCLVTGLYVLLGRCCPLRVRMYRQRSFCEVEGEPFQNKVDMVVAEIELFEPVPGTQTYTLVNISVHSKQVREAAHLKQEDWVEMNWPTSEVGQKKYAHLVCT